MARVPYVDPADLPADERSLLATSMDGDDLPDPYRHLFTTDVRNVHRAIANSPPLLRLFRSTMSALWAESGLGKRERELVILTVARATGARYEWHQHVRHALADGFTPDECRAVAALAVAGGNDDGGSAGLSDDERTLVAGVGSICRGTLTDEGFAALSSRYDDATVVGLTFLAGWYIGLAHVLATLDVEPEEPFVGWDLAGS